MTVTKDIKGQVFGRLTAIKKAGKNKRNKTLWRFKCSCGKYVKLLYSAVKSGHVRSCGCLHRDLVALRSTKHGYSKEELYETWIHMLNRCLNKNSRSYPAYGGRGIGIVKRWLNYSYFKKDVGIRPGKNYSLDRIDNNKGYSKRNCRWATCAEQSRNRRSNTIVIYKNKKLCLVEAAALSPVSYSTFVNRVTRLGWPIDKAINTPLQLSTKKKVGAFIYEKSFNYL